jgi:hypothetical protein
MLVEKKLGHIIKRIHTDDGGEYVNKYFIEIFSKIGIQM